MVSSLLLLVWSLIAAVSNMNVQAAVEANKFGAHVYEATDDGVAEDGVGYTC